MPGLRVERGVRVTVQLDQPDPKAVEAERALLGGLLQEPNELVEVCRTLRPDDFYRPEHGALYALLLAMQAKGEPIDMITVADRMIRGGRMERFGGPAYVAELPEHAPSTANLDYYARIIVRKAQLRQMIATCLDLANRAYSDDGDLSLLASGGAVQLTEIGSRVSAKQALWTMEELGVEYEQDAGGEELGSVAPPLGYGLGSQLDEMLNGGAQGGELVVIGGRPGMGKTGFAIGRLVHWARMGRGVLLASIEQRRKEIHLRNLAVALGQTTAEIKSWPADDAERRGCERDMVTLQVFDHSRPTMKEIEAQAARVQARWGKCAAIAIDYLKLVNHERERGDRPDQYIGRSAEQAKQLARKFDCPVLLLAQLNRKGEELKPSRRKSKGTAWWDKVALPEDSHLRDSGDIEAHADVILFPVSGAGYDLPDPGLGAVKVAKNRNGKTGVVPLRWDGPCATYRGT